MGGFFLDYGRFVTVEGVQITQKESLKGNLSGGQSSSWSLLRLLPVV